MLPNGLIALRLAALVAAPMPPDAAPHSDLEPDQVLVSYQVALGRYQVSGVSTRLDWSVTSYPDGSAELRLQVPVESFSSGHPDLDRALRLAAGEGATIDIEGVAKVGVPVMFVGTLTFHGVTRPFGTALTLNRTGATIVVRTAFTIDLDSFGVVRPAAIGSKVDVEFAARLRVHPRAVVSGGAVDSKRR